MNTVFSFTGREIPDNKSIRLTANNKTDNLLYPRIKSPLKPIGGKIYMKQEQKNNGFV